MMRCDQCKWGSLFDENEEIGICKRYPPFFIGIAENKVNFNEVCDDATDNFCQPWVPANDYCGEFSLKDKNG